MGYYMRFIVTGEIPVTPADIQTAFREADAGYRFEGSGTEVIVHHGEQQLAHVTLDGPEGQQFEEEREELLEAAGEACGRRKSAVLKALRAARQIVAIQVLHGTGDIDSSLKRIDPLWGWLMTHREGLIQADGEGYYEGNRLILEVE